MIGYSYISSFFNWVLGLMIQLVCLDTLYRIYNFKARNGMLFGICYTGPMNYELSKVTLEHVDLLTEVAKRTFVETFSADNTPEDMNDYVSKSFSHSVQSEEINNPLRHIFLVQTSDGPIGYLHLYESATEFYTGSEKQVELVRLYLDKKWHGKGIADGLMQKCLEYCQALSAKILWLGVWERNQRAQAFYRKWGFVECGSHYFQLGNDSQRDLVLIRKIESIAK